MRTIVLMIAIVAGLLLAGCGTNPMGATTRQNLRSQAEVERARLEALAQVETARAYAEAQEHAATQETLRSGIWAATVPWALLIVVGGAVVALVVNWQGRIWYARTQAQGWTATPPALPRREHPQLRQIRLLAQRDGYDVEVVGQIVYLLADGRRVGQRLLTGD